MMYICQFYAPAGFSKITVLAMNISSQSIFSESQWEIFLFV